MIRLTLNDLHLNGEGHVLHEVLPGDYLYAGGLAFASRGERSHTNDGPGGGDWHVHSDREAFIVMQGRGAMEVNGRRHDVRSGDVIIIEPGEDHHLCSSEEDPVVVMWCHAGPERHPQQRGEQHDGS
ncbi:cupin domain-containing protein [Paenibacillus sp. J5C_2022]|uniref:cupin domain-containing protein n=1 Tax=Paenibacillus sp. J5C2022 TaxID=2977129 RepID=UPI0021D346ED|nr:cupin domain-containing protein [Paenibacillus sp. J5C2022]MCU6712292.1 cupin domain-containing protein [Paenibacillus sp. J5C2022]